MVLSKWPYWNVFYPSAPVTLLSHSSFVISTFPLTRITFNKVGYFAMAQKIETGASHPSALFSPAAALIPSEQLVPKEIYLSCTWKSALPCDLVSEKEKGAVKVCVWVCICVWKSFLQNLEAGKHLTRESSKRVRQRSYFRVKWGHSMSLSVNGW